LAGQALSRIKRAADKLGKKTEELFVLDFFNKSEDIKTSFDPFYTSTSLSQATDVNVLHEIKSILDDVGVYEWSEVEDFNEKYFNKVPASELSPIIDIAAARFNALLELEDAEKADFKIKAKHFVKIYGQMASIMEFPMLKWEKLFWFLKFLVPKLIITDPNADVLDALLNSIDLSTYGLERVKLNESIGLDDAESELDPQNPNPRGAHGSEEESDPLDVIIQNFNDRFYAGFDETPEEAKIRTISLFRNMHKHKDFEKKVKNNKDVQNSEIALNKIMNDVMLEKRKANVGSIKNGSTMMLLKLEFLP